MSSQHPHYAYDHLKADPNVSQALKDALPALVPQASQAAHSKAAERIASDMATVDAQRLALDFVRRLAMAVTASIDPAVPFRSGPFVDELAGLISRNRRTLENIRDYADHYEKGGDDSAFGFKCIGEICREVL